MFTILLLAGIVVSLVIVLLGSPAWKKFGIVLLLISILLIVALYYVLGQATRGSFGT